MPVASGGEAFAVYSLDSMAVPAFLTSSAGLIATADQIIMSLAGRRSE